MRALFVALLLLAPASAQADFLKMPLGKFTAVRRVDLRCTSGSYGMSLAIPDRWAVKSATITFSYVNSTALLPENSRLMAKINGDAIAQRKLSPVAPEGVMRVSIPPAALKPGYNELVFEVHQHYATGCEFPCQPELWTTLKLTDDDALIEIEYEPKKVPLRLSSVSRFLFDPKVTPRGEINIVIPDREPGTIAVASVLASGIAKKFDYREVVFSVSNDIVPGYDNIVVGDKEFAARFLAPSGSDLEEIKGPFLKIQALPRLDAEGAAAAEDPYHAMIVVSGLNKDHLKLAAETLAVMSSPFPETQQMTVTGITIPDIPIYGGKGVIKAGTPYTFKALNFPTHSFAGGSANAAEINFRLPADFLVKQNLYAKLSLNYSYGAGHRPDSVLNISLNGQLIRGINLDDGRGGLIEGYKLDIPSYLFRRGDNTLRFEPVLAPLVSKNCEYIQTQNLFLTIMDVSTLEFPPMPHFVDMPRLELFMLNGFPITRWPDGHGARVYLANTNRETIESALNIVGMITQKNGHPLLDLQYVAGQPKHLDGDLIVLGDIDSLPAKIRSAAPLSLNKEMAVPYPVVQGWAEDARYAFSKQISGLTKGTGALMQFESPYDPGHSVVLLAATSAPELLALSLSLLNPGAQASVKGDLVLLNLSAPEKDIIAVAIGKKYFSGKAGAVSRLDAYLYRYPWLYHALLAAAVLLLSLAIFYFLVRYRKKRILGE
ncbi:MAG: cellulose biosynthesis cyclic di-GMP-binding regulatory protein BcsB [Elusimicrobia bacterium]|nr:cellulose biosynthesis cyclic di-GMP-binding regulatory protein BcsB [Elusimicrobiota bacterium]